MQLRFSINVILCIALAGCSVPPAQREDFFGTWEGWNSQGDVFLVQHFGADGRGWILAEGRGTALGWEMDWWLDGPHLVTRATDDPTFSGEKVISDYRFEAQSLTLVRNEKDEATLRPVTSEYGRALEAEIWRQIASSKD